MFKKVLGIFKDLDSLTKKIMKYGFNFSICVCIVATMILLTYEVVYASPDLYYIGLQMVKTGLFFFVEFIICGVAMDKIKKQLI